jgi:uncharacterized protein
LGLDITPRQPSGRQIIKAYGDGGFRVAGVRHEGSILVFPDRTEAWPVTAATAVNVDSLAPMFESAGRISVLLVGCGVTFQPPPEGITQALRDAGIVLEWMDTGAACRTFNVLLLEDREVAAALIAVD